MEERKYKCGRCAKLHKFGFTCQQDLEFVNMIKNAAIATDVFGDDELERFAEGQRRMRSGRVKS